MTNLVLNRKEIPTREQIFGQREINLQCLIAFDMSLLANKEDFLVFCASFQNLEQLYRISHSDLHFSSIRSGLLGGSHIRTCTQKPLQIHCEIAPITDYRAREASEQSRSDESATSGLLVLHVIQNNSEFDPFPVISELRLPNVCYLESFNSSVKG